MNADQAPIAQEAFIMERCPTANADLVRALIAASQIPDDETLPLSLAALHPCGIRVWMPSQMMFGVLLNAGIDLAAEVELDRKLRLTYSGLLKLIAASGMSSLIDAHNQYLVWHNAWLSRSIADNDAMLQLQHDMIARLEDIRALAADLQFEEAGSRMGALVNVIHEGMSKLDAHNHNMVTAQMLYWRMAKQLHQMA